jgi:signal transduction histidine kinase
MMSQARVMIVEDNTTVAKDLNGCLDDLGYEVTSLQVSGEEAVEAAGIEMPDIVMMDIHLRDAMNGLTAAELIHNKYAIPVVFLSAYSDRNLLAKAKTVGAFGYLVKPFEERELFATIEMALYKANSEKKQQQMEAHLSQMQKMDGLRLMAGSIAHNFNNLLQVPLGYNEILMEELPVDSPSRKLIQESNTSLIRAAKISQLMLLFVGQGKGMIKDLDLVDELQKTVVFFGETLSELHTLKVDPVATPVNISGDPKQIRMVIDVLLVNATEAIGDEPGEIIISTRVIPNTESWLKKTFPYFEFSSDQYIMVEITDNGCGMDEPTRQKIFDPFFSTKFTGRGLGMASALGIIQGHEGTITVESKPGEGSTIKLLFPVTLENTVPQSPHPL